MEKVPSGLLVEALKLPKEARAALAASLIESLEDDVDLDAEVKWSTEVSRRVREIDSGTVSLVPWTEARRTIKGQ